MHPATSAKAAMNAPSQSAPEATPRNTPTITAVPTAVPTRWPVCRTPPAVPECRGGTSARLRVWLGETTSPCPAPKMARVSSSHHGLRPNSRLAHATPMEPTTASSASAMPRTTIFRPVRSTTRPATVDITLDMTAEGRPMSAACSAG